MGGLTAEILACESDGMPRYGFATLFVVALLWATPAEACLKCYQFYYVHTWCWYCDGAYCGLFDCEIKQHPTFGDYCDGNEGCFEVGRGCLYEPDMSLPEELQQPSRLGEKWRLAEVRVYAPRKQRTPRQSGP